MRSHEQLNRERAAAAAEPRFFLIAGEVLCIGGRWDGWIFRMHPDGHLVTDRKAARFMPPSTSLVP
jgi:hypothetical protein